MPPTDLFERLVVAKLREPADPGVMGGSVRTAPLEPWRLWPAALEAPSVDQPLPPARPEPDRHPVRDRLRDPRLSPAQRDALTALRRLGAAIADEFDASQLKAAFRRLALELHPDRHPGADLGRREWLGTRFAVLCEAYRTLSEPLPRP